jgi:hypothetical protein
MHRENHNIILLYVNNLILIARNKDLITKLKEIIYAKYKYRDLRPINFYLGIKITLDRTRRNINISIESYIKKIANEHHLTSSHKRNNPLASNALNFKLRPKDNLAPKQLLKEY